ncbi:7426_t:CDS:1 [Entrophospora sp. SA101]|nr:7426_t:CDS:1 [Entrophospora sp. SA101]
MAPVRYSSPSRNQNENNSPQNLHNTMFRRTHWTNEPNNMNWETYHRLQNQLQQLEMEILNWEIEITIRPSTPAHVSHWKKLRRLHKHTKERLNILLTNSNHCPHCNQESEQDPWENNEQ